MGVLLFASLLMVSAEPPLKAALIIANNQSLDREVMPLKFADDDGARLYELLRGFGYEAQLFTVLDRDTAEQHPDVVAVTRPPTWQRLSRAVLELKKRVRAAHGAGREVELIVAYTGHGATGPRGEPYVNLLDRRLFRAELYRDLAFTTGADVVHVFLDVCRARDFADTSGGPDAAEFARERSLFLAPDARRPRPEVGLLVAESADPETHEWARTRSGIVGHEILSGLTGAADVNGDGRIEYSELHAFIAAANDELRDPRARLLVTVAPPLATPRRPILEVPAEADLERLQTPAIGGRFVIEDDRGVRWVDVAMEKGQEATLLLPRRPRYVIVDITGEREVTLERQPAGITTPLAALEFTPQTVASARGGVAAALESPLFRTPFGPMFYQTFVASMHYPSTRDAGDAPSLALVEVPTVIAPPPVEVATGEGTPSADTAGDLVAAASPVDAPPGPTTPPSTDEAPKPAWPASRVLRYVALLTSVAALGAGGLLGYETTVTLDEIRKTPQVQTGSLVDRRRGQAIGADVAFGLAGGALITWGVTWLFE